MNRRLCGASCRGYNLEDGPSDAAPHQASRQKTAQVCVAICTLCTTPSVMKKWALGLIHHESCQTVACEDVPEMYYHLNFESQHIRLVHIAAGQCRCQAKHQ